jgi:hypothetical protein
MTTYGASHCAFIVAHSGTSDALFNAIYYDGQRVFQQIANFTGDHTTWDPCAIGSRRIYRDDWVIPNGGGLPGYHIWTQGLTNDWLVNGNTTSRDAAHSLRTSGLYCRDTTPIGDTVSAELSREVAFCDEAYMNDVQSGYPSPARLPLLISQSYGHINQWFDVPMVAGYVRPFMFALTAESLIDDFQNTGDVRALPAIKKGADWIWTHMWNTGGAAGSFSFEYTNIDTSTLPPTAPGYNTGGTEPSPDLNLMICPVFAWIYAQTGDTTYRDRHDECFTHGVDLAFLGGTGKQFNENYRWSIQGTIWRLSR